MEHMSTGGMTDFPVGITHSTEIELTRLVCEAVRKVIMKIIQDAVPLCTSQALSCP